MTMQNPFVGHSHGPSPYFMPDCPLCDAQKEARNRAIAHLHEALLLASTFNDTDSRTVRLNLGPTHATGENVSRCHSIDLTAKQIEALADAIDSKTAHAASQPDDTDQQFMDRMAAVADARIAGWEKETIPGGEWSAAAVAQNDTDIWDQVNDAFATFDVRQISADVMNDPNPDTDPMDVIRALDATFGDNVHDSLADEDDV
ncbi:hypothetical protein ACGFZS_46865 [Streptomyces sp. NPDC048288]|uniref:hypothetical protein n=1 Tax=Streptomyces sp. NPDC048288 TaxID=3365529 RepID=UPI0037188144